MKTYLVHKNQIQGFKDVSETVKTVEKISASSIHFLKQKVVNLNIYADEVERVLSRLSLFYQKKNHPLLQKKRRGEKVLVILAGDRGLVGSLWHRLVSVSLEKLKQYQSIIVVGAKGEAYLKEENVQIIRSFSRIFDSFQKEKIEDITNYIFGEFKKEKFSQVDILYPRFISLAEQQPFLVSFLPFKFNFKKERVPCVGLPIFEPSKGRIFDKFLQKYIGMFFYKIIMETRLSELSARTVAMEQAAVKTDRLIRKLALAYMKERRRVITQKQLESFVVHKII